MSFNAYAHGSHPMTASQFLSKAGNTISHDTQTAEHAASHEAQQVDHSFKQTGHTINKQMNKQFKPYEHPKAPDHGHCLSNKNCMAGKAAGNSQNVPWYDFWEASGDE